MKIMHDSEQHRFDAIADDGAHMGKIEYSPHGDILSATHTLVEKPFRGQGVAGKLLDALVDYAKANNFKIIPVCSYVVASFKQHPERYRAVMCE